MTVRVKWYEDGPGSLRTRKKVELPDEHTALIFVDGVQSRGGMTFGGIFSPSPSDPNTCETEWCNAIPPEGAKRCGECEFARAMASAEPPEGGWPRGSDMDRL